MGLFVAWVRVDLTMDTATTKGLTMDGTINMGGLTMELHNREMVLIEVYRSIDRTFEQLGSGATEADYAADVIRRLSDIYESEV